MTRKLAILVVLLAVLSALVVPFGPAQAQDGGEPVVITWFIGLGAGGQPEHQAAQNAIVEQFNAEHDDIELEIIVADFDVSRDTLSTLIASGDAPDIIGPVELAARTTTRYVPRSPADHRQPAMTSAAGTPA